MKQTFWEHLLSLIMTFIRGQMQQSQAKAAPSQVAPLNPMPSPKLKSAQVTKVIDGDTIELATGETVRYLGINTPEREHGGYDAAKSLNQKWVKGKTVQLEFDVASQDQYGRTLAYVWVDKVLVNQELLKQGCATMLFVPPNERYKAQFRQAEQAARQAKLGIWQGSNIPLKIIQVQANAPGEDNANPNGEWIEIVNQGKQTLSLQNYMLKDSANNIYTFGKFSLAAGAKVRLYSGQGKDSATALYWGMVDNSVWNNDSDTAFLRDPQGGLVDSYSYGA